MQFQHMCAPHLINQLFECWKWESGAVWNYPFSWNCILTWHSGHGDTPQPSRLVPNKNQYNKSGGESEQHSLCKDASLATVEILMNSKELTWQPVQSFLSSGFSASQTCFDIKHCQRHNGPEGWVLLTKVTSSNTNLGQNFNPCTGSLILGSSVLGITILSPKIEDPQS